VWVWVWVGGCGCVCVRVYECVSVGVVWCEMFKLRRGPGLSVVQQYIVMGCPTFEVTFLCLCGAEVTPLSLCGAVLCCGGEGRGGEGRGGERKRHRNGLSVPNAEVFCHTVNNLCLAHQFFSGSFGASWAALICCSGWARLPKT